MQLSVSLEYELSDHMLLCRLFLKQITHTYVHFKSTYCMYNIATPYTLHAQNNKKISRKIYDSTRSGVVIKSLLLYYCFLNVNNRTHY